MSYQAEISTNFNEEPKVFSIDHVHLSFHDLQMEVKDIVGFCYGTTPDHGTLSTEMLGFSATGAYFYRFIDTSNDIIDFNMMYWPGNFEQVRTIATQIEYWVWEYIGVRLLNDTVRHIHAGYNITIGNVLLNRNGVHFTDNRHTQPGTDYSLDWHEVTGWTENVILQIRSKRNDRISFPVELYTTINALILQRILQYIDINAELREILRGLRPPLA